MAKYDNMSFKKAFAAARKEMGAGKNFTWKGKSYTTNLKEEAGKKKVEPTRPKARPTAPLTSKRPGDRATVVKNAAASASRANTNDRGMLEANIKKAQANSGSNGKPSVDSTTPKLGGSDTSTKPLTVAGRKTATAASETTNTVKKPTTMTAAEKAKADAEARRAKSRAGTSTATKKKVTAVGNPSGGGFFKTLGDIISSGGLSSQHKKRKK